jgi:hypothetical protein
MLSIAMYDQDEQSAGMEVSRYVRRRSRLCKIPT